MSAIKLLLQIKQKADVLSLAWDVIHLLIIILLIGNQIINGKREITTDTALRLGKYFGIEPEFWLNLQMRFNMKIVKEKTGKQIDKEVKKYLPPTSQTNHTSP